MGVTGQAQVVTAVVAADLRDRDVLAQQRLQVVEHLLALRVVAGLTAGLLHLTVLGRHIYAVGSNEATARLCGVPIARPVAVSLP